MSMTIPTTSIRTLGGRVDEAVDQYVAVRDTPAEQRPGWSLTGAFDDRNFAESLGARPILAPGAPTLAA